MARLEIRAVIEGDRSELVHLMEGLRSGDLELDEVVDVDSDELYFQLEEVKETKNAS